MNALDVSKIKDIKSVYLISGNDSYLVKRAINDLKALLVEGMEEFNYQRLEGSEIKEGDLNSIVNTLPFGSTNRLVVIDNITSGLASVIEKFNKIPFYNVVVAVVNPNVKLSGEEINCDHLSNIELKKYLVNYLKEQGASYEDEALDYIIEISGGDLTYIINELNKLLGYLEEEEKVTIDNIKLMFTKNENFFVYNLCSAIDSKNKAQAMKILNSLQESSSVGEIFTFMGSNFRKMFYCAINPKNDTVANCLKIKPYAVTKAREFVNKNGKGFYVNLYNKYIELDHEIKSGKMSPLNAIYSLIIF